MSATAAEARSLRPPNDLLSVAEAGDDPTIPRKAPTIYRMISQGELQAWDQRGVRLVSRAELLAAIERVTPLEPAHLKRLPEAERARVAEFAQSVASGARELSPRAQRAAAKEIARALSGGASK